MTRVYEAPKFRTFEEKYVKRLEALSGRTIDNETWWDALDIFFDWQEEEEGGTPETRQRQHDQRRTAIRYVAWCLRHDLDGAWHLHPYPCAVTQRLKALWPLAQYLYMVDDASGFLGPASGELIYLMRAIVASRKLGNTDFEELPLHLTWWTDWYDVRESETENPEFKAWVEAGEFEWMFNHRGTKEEWETRSRFVPYEEAIERGKKRREQSREGPVDDGAVCSSE